MSKKRKRIALIVIILLICLLLFVAPRSRIIYGAYCCKCLRQASITEKKIYGIPYYRKTILYYGTHSMYSSYSDANYGEQNLYQEVFYDPNIYENIYDAKCHHYFKKRSFGERKTLFLMPFSALIIDGGCAEGILGKARMEGVLSIYKLYKLTDNKEQAKLSYQILDTLHSPQKIQPKFRGILNDYNLQLNQVKSLEEWIKINDDCRKIIESKTLLKSES